MPEVPERPKNISPRAWAVATAHLKPKYPIGSTKVNPPIPKDFLPEELVEKAEEDEEEERD